MTLSDDLDGIFLDIGPHRIQVIDAINDWADWVLKLLFDSREQSLKSTGSVWSLYDLIASLIRRDAIERTINSQLRSDARISILKAIDELFESFTRQIEFDVAALPDADPEPHDQNWWWNRIPSAGPLAREASSLIETYFSTGGHDR